MPALPPYRASTAGPLTLCLVTYLPGVLRSAPGTSAKSSHGWARPETVGSSNCNRNRRVRNRTEREMRAATHACTEYLVDTVDKTGLDRPGLRTGQDRAGQDSRRPARSI